MNRYRFFLCCFLLALGACLHRQPAVEAVTPPEVFKVHPGLLGEPAPPELRSVQDDAETAAEEAQDAIDDAAN
ncbi:MAG: hypothetical protein LBD68_04080 [Zoogloeaceae bacterium]|jgi:hypothetical protein|nr:hypothetical protein [Zoogloeaceae bacterium]